MFIQVTYLYISYQRYILVGNPKSDKSMFSIDKPLNRLHVVWVCHNKKN